MLITWAIRMPAIVDSAFCFCTHSVTADVAQYKLALLCGGEIWRILTGDTPRSTWVEQVKNNNFAGLDHDTEQCLY